LVEQRTFNPFVVGSTPAGPTKIFNQINSLQEIAGYFFVQSLRNSFSAPQFCNSKG
jgi:hypothetical protein